MEVCHFPVSLMFQNAGSVSPQGENDTCIFHAYNFGFSTEEKHFVSPMKCRQENLDKNDKKKIFAKHMLSYIHN